MDAVVWLIEKVISLYIWAIILAAVFSTLASFGVIDTRNRLVWTVMDFLERGDRPGAQADPAASFLIWAASTSAR